MTQAGFSGNPRYIILGTSLLAVIGGVGFGRVVRLRRRARARAPLRPPRRTRSAGIVVFAVLCARDRALGGAALPTTSASSTRRCATRRSCASTCATRSRRPAAPSAFKACGKATAGKFSVPLVAWYLDEHTLDVGLAPAPQGVIVAARTTNKQSLKPQPQQPYPPGYAPVADGAHDDPVLDLSPDGWRRAPSAPASLRTRMATVAVPRTRRRSSSCARPTRCSPASTLVALIAISASTSARARSAAPSGWTRASRSASPRTPSRTSRACSDRTARRRSTTCCCTSGWTSSAAARRPSTGSR